MKASNEGVSAGFAGRRLAGPALSALLLAAAPSWGADLARVELDVRPDFGSRSMEISARLEVDNPQLETLFEYGLSDAWSSVTVSSPDADLGWERSPGAILVRLERPVPCLTLDFELAGPAAASVDEKRSNLTSEDLFLLWSDRFYPIDFEDWAQLRVDLTLPVGYEAIAPGRLVSREPVAAGERWRFETTQPVRDISVFADRRWIRRVHDVDGRRIVTLLHPESDGLAGAVARSSADVLDFFAELHGGVPFDGFAFVTLEGLYARRAFPGFVGYSPAYLAREMERTGHDAHETSLLWWGYAFGGRGPGSFQWLEGLGDYAEILYDEARGFPVPAIFERFRAEYLAADPDEEPAIEELRGNTPQKFVHGKYPWLMHVLRGELGDARFRAGLRELVSTCRFRACTLDELVAALERGSGASLERWRQQWLERQGVPVLECEVVNEPGAVRVRLRQTAELYDLPLELALEGAASRRIERIDLPAQRETEVVLETAEPVRRVALDPGRMLLIRPADADCAP